MADKLDFGAIFAELAESGEGERHVVMGGVDVRLVRVAAGGAGRWDAHDDVAETVLVWSGAFNVAFRDRTTHLTKGEFCVVPLGVEHKGTSPDGAEVALFKARPLAG